MSPTPRRVAVSPNPRVGHYIYKLLNVASLDLAERLEVSEVVDPVAKNDLFSRPALPTGSVMSRSFSLQVSKGWICPQLQRRLHSVSQQEKWTLKIHFISGCWMTGC